MAELLLYKAEVADAASRQQESVDADAVVPCEVDCPEEPLCS